MGIFQKPAIGLDLSDRSIEAVFIVRSGNRLVVSSYGRASLPPGAIVDGYVEKREVVSQVLRKLLADQMTPPLPQGVRRVVFALPESQVYSHIFEVPRVADESELGRSLAIEADGYFPYNHQEMFSGYALIGQRPDKKEIFYAAVHRDTLKSYLSLLAASGLTPVAIESESASIARATRLPGETDPVLYVDIGARVTDLSIFDLNGVQFSETLETAGDAFTAALSRSLGISEDDAESLKRTQGLSLDLDLRAQKALGAEVDGLAREVLAALKFYEQGSKRLVSRIVLCGGSTLMPGLVEALTEKIALPGRSFHVETADPWAGLQFHPTLEKLDIRARGVLAATAVGLAERGLGVRKFAEIDFLASAVAADRQRPASGIRGVPAPMRVDLRPPRSRLLRLPLWAKLAILAAALALTLALAFTIRLLAFKTGPSVPGASNSTSSPDTLSFTATVALGPSFSAAAGTIEGTPVTVTQDFETSVDHQASRSEGKAKGTVEIVDDGRAAQTLVANTRLLSVQGVLFRLDDRVTVPAGGRVTVGVTADQPGEAGDVPAGRFSIPGLPLSTQKLVYGESKAAMSGGLVLSGPPLTQEELDAALSGVTQDKTAMMLGLAQAQAGADHVLPDALYSLKAEPIDPPEVGLPTESFMLKVRLTASGTALPTDQLQQLLSDALKAQLSSGADPQAYDIQPTGYVLQSGSGDSAPKVILVSATAKRKNGT